MPDAQEIYAYLLQPITPSTIQRAIEMGMLARETLKDRVVYEGFCRNAICAMWDVSNQEFWYYRHEKKQRETIPYASDWNGWDIFVPVGEADPYDSACYFG